MVDDVENLKGETALAIRDKDEGPHHSEEIGRAIRAATADMKRKRRIGLPLQIVTPARHIRLGKYLSGDISILRRMELNIKHNFQVSGIAREKSREVFIVIAILVATATYQDILIGTYLVISMIVLLVTYGDAIHSILPPHYSFVRATVTAQIVIAFFFAFGIAFARFCSALRLKLGTAETGLLWELVRFDDDADRHSNIQHAEQKHTADTEGHPLQILANP
ncbi:hypothetical protein CRG98_036825 [Punica granatum]|uniref:Uncharacterized protein n=1 Tax=Punica granatum TaxID=22663 RepID=A0A2I0IFM3_PUNGR|nr:hypothetical protein CRG98_036825 [Punica granatum]